MEKDSGMQRMIRGIRSLAVVLALLTALSGFGQQTGAFFRIIAPTNTKITAFDSQGYLTWTNAATAGVTCTVQRAATLAGPSNWVDYVRHSATNATMALRVHDPAPPPGMALIPAGSFQMGDSFGGEGWDDELPVHTVYVSAFYMDRTEVTWAKWKEVRTWALANGYDMSAGAGKADNHPVQNVTWYACVKYCNALSQMEGRSPCYFTHAGIMYKTLKNNNIVCNRLAGGYRLPTEAEWEKAARGGLSNKRFPWGDTIQHNLANYYASSSWDGYDTNGYDGYHPSYNDGTYPYTSPVGSFAPNGYGLYDLCGNLWEWCFDWANTYSSGSEIDPSGPYDQSPDWGLYRVNRGGSWDVNAIISRLAYRNFLSPSSTPPNVGFRAVLTPCQ